MNFAIILQTYRYAIILWSCARSFERATIKISIDILSSIVVHLDNLILTTAVRRLKWCAARKYIRDTFWRYCRLFGQSPRTPDTFVCVDCEKNIKSCAPCSARFCCIHAGSLPKIGWQVSSQVDYPHYSSHTTYRSWRQVKAILAKPRSHVARIRLRQLCSIGLCIL